MITIKKKQTIILLIIIILLAIFAVQKICTGPKKPYLQINKTKISLELADTDEKRIRGLSDRVGLKKDSGMLFIFPNKESEVFWMKDMKFPLDIIWIDGDRIIKIDKDLPPEGSVPMEKYYSEAPVDRVLEVKGGFVNEQGIRAGDKVDYFSN